MMRKNQMYNKLRFTNLFLIILLSALIVIAAKYIWLPILKNTSLYNQTYKAYQDNRWVTFTSERAMLSFRHPLSWPVSSASDEQLKEINQDFVDGKWMLTDNTVERISFEKEFTNQAGGPSLGFIIVEKTSYKTLKEYVDELSKEKVVDMSVKGVTQKVTIKPPRIEYLKIGGEDTISLTDINDFASFSNLIADYQLI